MQNIDVGAGQAQAPTIHLAMAEVGSPAAREVINQWSSPADEVDVQRPDRLLARALLRGLLSKLSPRLPDGWRLTKDSEGKPLLTGSMGAILPSISLSHSASWSACAASFDGDVGIDIEAMRPDRDYGAIAARAFGPSECAEVAVEGKDRFYAIWTLREAIAKAAGCGLEMAADGRDRVLDGAQGSFRRLSIDGEHWQVMQRALPSGISLALALRMGPEAEAAPRLLWWSEEP